MIERYENALKEITEMEFAGENDFDADMRLNDAIATARTAIYGEDWDEWMDD